MGLLVSLDQTAIFQPGSPRRNPLRFQALARQGAARRY